MGEPSFVTKVHALLLGAKHLELYNNRIIEAGEDLQDHVVQPATHSYHAC